MIENGNALGQRENDKKTAYVLRYFYQEQFVVTLRDITWILH